LQYNNVMAGLVPAISIPWAWLCHSDRDGRDIGKRSDAVFDGYGRP
jgi:hypothetical protein